MIDAHDYRALSLTARLAVALHCFAGYCRARELRHPEIEAFLNDLWEFPIVNNFSWGDWEKNHPILIWVALGDALPDELATILDHEAVDPKEFRRLTESVAEIVFGSFYGAAQDAPALSYLSEVLTIVRSYDVTPPAASCFAESLFADGHGWGNPISVELRDAWRTIPPLS